MLVAMALWGCGDMMEEEVKTPVVNAPEYKDLVASVNSAMTRVYAEEDLSLAWHKEDALSVFYCNDYNNTFTFTGESGDKSGNFTLTGSGGVGATSLDRIYALYPYQASATIAADGTMSFAVPSVQSYAEASFPRDGNIMVAATMGADDTMLAFRNGVGYLQLKLYGEGTVKSIKVEGNAGEKIAGAATIVASTNAAPELIMGADATTTITLNCGAGVALGNDKSVPTEFWIAMPETTFSSGITITVTDTDDSIFTKKTSNEVVVARNYIKPMAALEAKFEATKPKSNEIWYTTTDGVKLSFDSGAFSTTIDKQEKVGDKWVITFADVVTSLNTLQNGYGAFDTKTTLTSVTLPDSVVTIGGYSFYSCTALKSITLSDSVISIGEMAFTDCTALSSIMLPVSLTSLDSGAFFNCDSLTTITLPENLTSIGESTFNNCDALSTVYSMAAIPPSLGLNAFKTRGDKFIYVPEASYSDYYNAWTQYKDNIVGEPYLSTDFSADGEVVTLQSATVGNGIDIVLMGDGYSDRHIANGRYEQDMRRAMEHFFAVEPFTSFRNMFNVYMVKCVSLKEGCNDNYTYGDTAFNCKLKSDGISIDGDTWEAYAYARGIVGETRLDETVTMVIMNSRIHAGVCYMSEPEVNVTSDYGSGKSLSFFPLCGDDDAFCKLVQHEACGHGFGKLADEYYSTGNGHITDGGYYDIKDYYWNMGWFKNIDCILKGATPLDASTVRWRHFLEDSRYANEGLGVYEGGYTYALGVYRPTEDSLMHHRNGGFNAPSREAIYIRIHKLAYGADWQYNYEEFVTWDSRNRE